MTSLDTGFDIIRSPADGSEITRIARISPAGVTAIADRLRAAQPAWEALGADGRAAWLTRWRDWLTEHQSELIDLIQQETGKAYGDAASEPAYGGMVMQ